MALHPRPPGPPTNDCTASLTAPLSGKLVSHLALEADVSGYLALAFAESPGAMVPAYSILGKVEGGVPSVTVSYVNSYSPGGWLTYATDGWARNLGISQAGGKTIVCFSVGLADAALGGGTTTGAGGTAGNGGGGFGEDDDGDGVENEDEDENEEEDDERRRRRARSLLAGGAGSLLAGGARSLLAGGAPVPTLSTSANLNYAFSYTGTALGLHDVAGSVTIDFATGASASLVVTDVWIVAHGALMTAAWAALLPAGILVARYRRALSRRSAVAVRFPRALLSARRAHRLRARPAAAARRAPRAAAALNAAKPCTFPSRTHTLKTAGSR